MSELFYQYLFCIAITHANDIKSLTRLRHLIAILVVILYSFNLFILHILYSCRFNNSEIFPWRNCFIKINTSFWHLKST